MKDAKRYREYEAECRRLAEIMPQKDKAVLLQMAEAWAEAARQAETLPRKRDDQGVES